MPEGENQTVSCGIYSGAVFILSLALFIFAMVVLDEINGKNLTELNNNYVNMIKWCISYAYAEIALVCSVVLFIIIGLICLVCCDSPVLLFVLFCIQFIAGFAIQIVYVASAVPIRYNVMDICDNINVNTTSMCNFYTTNFNPMVIILIVLLAINCINIFILSCAGCVMLC
jgi:hypothetical protein